MHEHSGKSSRIFFKPNKILEPLHLDKSMTLLDAGCGDGYLSVAAAKKVKKVYAIDIHEESINKLKSKNIPNIEARVGDFSILPNVDVCLLVNVLHGLIANEEPIDELMKIKKIAVVEFKKNSIFGPSKNVKLGKEQVLDIFKGYKEIYHKNFLMHYMVVLQK